MTPDRLAPTRPRLRLETFLHAAGIDFAFLEPGVPMPTVPLAAEAIGVAPDQIIKSVLFTAASGHAVLAIAAGTSRIDRARLSEISGLAKLKLADAETVLRRTGYPAGGVAPVGHAEPLPVVVDHRVLLLLLVYGGGGEEEILLRIAPEDIVRLTAATVADIVLATAD